MQTFCYYTPPKQAALPVQLRSPFSIHNSFLRRKRRQHPRQLPKRQINHDEKQHPCPVHNPLLIFLHVRVQRAQNQPENNVRGHGDVKRRLVAGDLKERSPRQQVGLVENCGGVGCGGGGEVGGHEGVHAGRVARGVVVALLAGRGGDGGYAVLLKIVWGGEGGRGGRVSSAFFGLLLGGLFILRGSKFIVCLCSTTAATPPVVMNGIIFMSVSIIAYSKQL